MLGGGELSALSPFLSLSLSRPFSCDDFIAANGNGSHVFAIIPHIVIMRQSHKAHTYTLSRVRAHSTKLFIKPYGFVFSLYIGRGSSLKENNKRETSVLDEYLKGSYHAFLIIAFFPISPLIKLVKFYALKTIIVFHSHFPPSL